MRFHYEQKHLDFIEKHCKLVTWQEVADLFEKEFNVKINYISLKRRAYKANIRTGRTGRFEKGRDSYNKGKKGLSFGGVATQFKKGHKPINYREVGSERVNSYGYVEIKVADPGKWRLKHTVIWEQEYGQIPTGKCLIFLDQNKQNVSLDNLAVITRSQLARMNQNGLFSTDPELTKAGTVIAELESVIGQLNKKSKRK